MKSLLITIFFIALTGCNGKVYSEKDIAKLVSQNNSWPMQVDGLFTIEVTKDYGGGADIHIFGSISSSEESFVAIYTLESVLIKNNISNGVQVIATIKPGDIDKETYDIVSIKTK